MMSLMKALPLTLLVIIAPLGAAASTDATATRDFCDSILSEALVNALTQTKADNSVGGALYDALADFPQIQARYGVDAAPSVHYLEDRAKIFGSIRSNVIDRAKANRFKQLSERFQEQFVALRETFVKDATPLLKEVGGLSTLGTPLSLVEPQRLRTFIYMARFIHTVEKIAAAEEPSSLTRRLGTFAQMYRPNVNRLCDLWLEIVRQVIKDDYSRFPIDQELRSAAEKISSVQSLDVTVAMEHVLDTTSSRTFERYIFEKFSLTWAVDLKITTALQTSGDKDTSSLDLFFSHFFKYSTAAATFFPELSKFIIGHERLSMPDAIQYLYDRVGDRKLFAHVLLYYLWRSNPTAVTSLIEQKKLNEDAFARKNTEEMQATLLGLQETIDDLRLRHDELQEHAAQDLEQLRRHRNELEDIVLLLRTNIEGRDQALARSQLRLKYAIGGVAVALAGSGVLFLIR